MVEMDKLDYKLTFYIGLGFFTTGITWALYDSYVPIFLRHYIVGDWRNLIIGFIMVLDNIAAITLQPWIGAKSDRTWTRWGRRMPYIMVGIPIAAIFFGLIPLSFNIWFLLAVITVFNIAMATYRAPVVALMPDIIPSKFRSKANGVINLMGGVGAIYAFTVGAILYKINPFYTFAVTSVIMVLALLVLLIKVKEPEVPYEKDELEKIGIIKAFKEVITSHDRSALAILFAILSWFIGYQIISTWYTTYGVEVLKIHEADASMMLTAFALTFIIFSIPAGFLASKFGRKGTIQIGLTGIIIIMMVIFFTRDYFVILAALAIAGMFWAFVNINSITIVWEIATPKKLGAYTGLYYFFSSLAAISGPTISGLLFDIFGIENMFLFSAIFFILAFVFMLGVKSGEVQESERMQQ